MKKEMPLPPFQVNASWYESYWLTEVPAKPRGRWVQRLIAALSDFRIERLHAHRVAAMRARMHRLHLDEI